MARKKQEQQQAQQAQEVQEQQNAQATGNQAAPDLQQQEELQKLMQLPLSQIETLPQAKRELVWQELARQLVEIPQFSEGTSALAKIIKSTTDILPAIEPRLQQLQESISQFAKTISTALEPAENLKRLLAERISEETLLAERISEETLEALSTMGTLAPYIKAERDEHPELYDDDTPFSDLIAAAARRARKDGKDIPPLKAEEPEPEQLQFDLPEETDKEELRRKHIEEAHRRRELARQEGALATTDGKLAIIAEKSLGFDYFTSGVIKLLPAGIENFILDEQGRINLYDLTGGNKSIHDTLQEVGKVHTAFLMWLLILAWNNSDIRETNSGNAIMPVYLPAVLEEMKIDPRPRERDQQTHELKARDTDKTLAEMRLDKFMGFISPLRNVAAWFGDDLYQIVGFYSYNAESETAYITTPYMYRLVEYAKLHATKHGAIKNIFHADIMTENQTAVEIANRIAMGLITRGVTTADSSTYQTATKPIKTKKTTTAPDGTKTVIEQTFIPDAEAAITKSRTDENGITTAVTSTMRKKEKAFTFRIKFSTLIADCPQLQRELDEIRNGESKDKSQRINKKLKDTFTAAIRIIMEKSEIPKYYKKLTIRTGNFDTFKAPTNSTLREPLIITHNGKDPNFKE